ncbi:MAG TPA: FAD-binding and (Fe-S)-binding domain-containing protein [Propionicimonas sp.]|nr:FAD-binding and (Fe-S)-binding domain-containing protein [Propionicimonas sp.]
MPDAAGFTEQVSALASAGLALDSGTLTRALYSSDASLYRVPPAAVARPASVTELSALVDAARTAGVPITARGAGTSIAGNAVGPGLVLDCSRLDRIAHVDPLARAAIVEPGVVPSRLTAAAAKHGLRFGPDPSTADRCTVGGMIGNNACGPRALGYGRTADNVLGLEAITGTGERLSLAPGAIAASGSATLTALQELVQANLGVIRTQFGRFPRQVSGYSLEHLLPENGFDVARFLVGSEGTLAVVTGARLRLVEDLPNRLLVVIGYPSMAAAADATPLVLESRPTAVEGFDRRILEVVRRRRGADAVPNLAAGDGWLFVELTDSDPDRLAERAGGLVQAAGGLATQLVFDQGEAARLWRIRADGAGLASVSLARPAHAGWEDAAVPPAVLGAYLRDFDALLAAHGLHGLPYGHFGEGCVHVRIDFDLSAPAGVAGYRRFVTEAAELAAHYGGSCSGEHGDGRARSELLPKMYSAQALALFAAVKHLFDPQNLLNPGVLVDPRPLDADLRLPAAAVSALPRLDDQFAADVHRCTGVGKCLVAGDGVMCPSYQATGRERDSTRGRAHALQEMVNGTLVTGGWRAAEVHEALELCLSCKACASECPTGTDVAAYKSRVLAEAYRHRLRPRSHYVLGRLPLWGRLVTGVPGLAGLANATLRAPLLGRAAKWLAGVDSRRLLPAFSGRRGRSRPDPLVSGRRVVVWVDSFTDTMDASRVDAMLAVLVDAGFAPSILRRTACCGLPWITTGQREQAARLLAHSVEILHPIVAAGTPIVGLEPSCVAVWRSDAAELVTDERLPEVAASIHTLAELLATAPEWPPPDLSGTVVVAQPHCHHASVLGWAADAALLARTGAKVVTVSGCCGLAGNFGVEIGHYETSVAVAQNHLLPAVASAGPDAVLLADGFSCRLQLADLAGRPSLTLAELLTPSVRP